MSDLMRKPKKFAKKRWDATFIRSTTTFTDADAKLLEALIDVQARTTEMALCEQCQQLETRGLLRSKTQVLFTDGKMSPEKFWSTTAAGKRALAKHRAASQA